MNINDNTTKPIFIEIYFNETKLSTATGFAILHQNKKYLVTNWHVVSGRNFITKECLSKTAAIPNKLILRFKKYINHTQFEWIEQEVNLFDENENKLWHEHPKYGSKVDVVLIMIEDKLESIYPLEYFRINSSCELNITEKLFVLGFPLGYIVKSRNEPYAIWTSGTIASEPSLNLVINNEEVPAFLIDSRTGSGQSGSPVIYYSLSGIDSNHSNGFTMWGGPIMREVGIYSGRIDKDSDLGYVWKWSVIQDIINSIK